MEDRTNQPRPKVIKRWTCEDLEVRETNARKGGKLENGHIPEKNEWYSVLGVREGTDSNALSSFIEKRTGS